MVGAIDLASLLGLQHKHISVTAHAQTHRGHVATLGGLDIGDCYSERERQWRFEMKKGCGYPLIISRGKTKQAAVRAAIDQIVALGKQVNRVLTDAHYHAGFVAT